MQEETIGGILQSWRKKQGKLISDCANELNAPIEYLDAIENNFFIEMPNDQYAFNLVNKYVGSGVTVGPDSKVNELVSAIESIQPAPTAKPIVGVSTEPLGEEFQGTKRHEKWFAVTGDTTTKCSPQESKWINLKFAEDGGVTIKQ